MISLRGLIATVIGFLFWEWYFIDIFETQQSQMRFFLIHGWHLSGRVQCSHRVTIAIWTTMNSGNPIYHERHMSGRVQCSHRATAVSKVVTGSLPTISITRPGNPIYEWLYEFKLHCHLLGNLSHHFDNNGIRSRETVNINIISIIVEYWDQPDICLWKITNYLAILRLRKPLKTSTRLAGHRIWIRDLPNASLVRYQESTSLGLVYFNEDKTNLKYFKTFTDLVLNY